MVEWRKLEYLIWNDSILEYMNSYILRGNAEWISRVSVDKSELKIMAEEQYLLDESSDGW